MSRRESEFRNVCAWEEWNAEDVASECLNRIRIFLPEMRNVFT